MTEPKTFIPLNVSSKFAICGMPIRMDTYKNCSFGCKYCFANYRKVMEFDKELRVADTGWLERKLAKVFTKKSVSESNFLEVLMRQDITFHCGGMSDPFQPCEQKYKATAKCIDICNRYGRTILFSTKSDTVYGADIRPDLHTFQLSVTGADKDLEPNVPDIEKRLSFFKMLLKEGFRVGVRIQPFIPAVTQLDIVKAFRGGEHFTLEGLKLVPQNKEHREVLMKKLGLKASDFTQMGLLNLKPEIRQRLYKPFIEYFEASGISYSIADNDMHNLGNNLCCCGDKLVKKASCFNNTALFKKYGMDYSAKDVFAELGECAECRCNNLFASNRQEGCKTVREFYENRLLREDSPFSKKFTFRDDQLMFDF